MFTVFDIETTGLSILNDDIIQLAYAVFDDNNSLVKSECLYFYHPAMTWSDEAFQVHKIPLEFLKKFENDFETNCIKIYSALNNTNVVGHNAAKFDCPFVKTWLAKRGLFNFEYNSIHDTMRDFKPLTHTTRISLRKLLAMFPKYTDNVVQQVTSMWFDTKDIVNAHDARFDVTSTALIALEGIRAGFFNPHETNTTTITSAAIEEYSSFDDNTDEAKPIDPNGFVIQCGNDYISCCHDTKKYAPIVVDDIDNLKEKNVVIPYNFTKLSDDLYTAKVDDVNFYLHRHDGVDYLEVVGTYGTITSDKLVMTDFIRRLNAHV